MHTPRKREWPAACERSHPAHVTRQPTYGICHPTYGTRQPIHVIHQPTYGICHPAYGTRQPAHVTRQPTHGICHPKNTVLATNTRNTPANTRDMPSPIRDSSTNTRDTPADIRDMPSSIRDASTYTRDTPADPLGMPYGRPGKAHNVRNARSDKCRYFAVLTLMPTFARTQHKQEKGHNYGKNSD